MTRKLGFTAHDLLTAVFATLVITLLLMQANVSSKIYAGEYAPTSTPSPTPLYYQYLPLVYCTCIDRPTPTPIPAPRPTPYWR